MAPRKEAQVLIPSVRVQQAMRGYTPVYGDSRDIAIRDAFSYLTKKLRTVDNKALRDLEANGDEKKMTSKMKDIIRTEQSIINWMEQRKFDF